MRLVAGSFWGCLETNFGYERADGFRMEVGQKWRLGAGFGGGGRGHEAIEWVWGWCGVGVGWACSECEEKV